MREKEETLYLLLMGMRSSRVRYYFSEKLMLAFTEVYMKTSLLFTNLLETILLFEQCYFNNAMFLLSRH